MPSSQQRPNNSPPVQQHQGPPPQRPADVVDPWTELRNALKVNRSTYAALLSGDEPATDAEVRRFVAACYQHVWHKPKLLESDMDSLLLAFAEAAAVNVSLNPTAKEGFIEVRKGIATFKIQYQGLIKLMHRGSDIDFIHVDVVRRGDHFRQIGGSDPRIEHEACPLGQEPDGYDSDDSILAAYAVVKVRGSSRSIHEVSRKADFMRARAMSTGPAWKQWMARMAMKVPLRRLANRLPGADAVRSIASIEDAHDNGEMISLEQLARAFGRHAPKGVDRDDLSSLMEASGPPTSDDGPA